MKILIFTGGNTIKKGGFSMAMLVSVMVVSLNGGTPKTPQNDQF